MMPVSCWCDERLNESTCEDVRCVQRGSDTYRTLVYLQGEPTWARESVFFKCALLKSASLPASFVVSLSALILGMGEVGIPF